MASNRKPELLAPAGGPEVAFAALHYGADAIYCGLPRFSARAEAENFTPAALAEVVGYAHSLAPRRRVYATLNTLILQREWPEAVRALAALEECGVDAVIVQDLGVARLAQRRFPALRLHASTQMAIHNLDGARVLRDWGFARATLARELTLDEAQTITAGAGLETEIFIHGALCYSYSGLCLFCSHEAGRSGNRGHCAYGCREVFSTGAARTDDGAPRMPFSMKDLALAGQVDELAASGVSSLKIEGRMKTALYVSAVTGYYRGRLDGRLSPAESARCEEDIRTIFSRPWTGLYAAGRDERGVVDARIVGHRGAPVGRVQSVERDRRGGFWLRFRTSRAIERHDGLQVDLPSESKPFGFAVDVLREAHAGGAVPGRDVIEARAGALVEVALPPGAPPLPAGADVYVSSSQDVKRRYRFDRPKPGLFRPHRVADVEADLSAERLTLRTRAGGEAAVEAAVTVDGPFAAARQPGATEAAVRRSFERWGDTDWQLGRLDVRDPQGCFVPASVLNEARRKLGDELTQLWRAASEARLTGLIEGETPAAPSAPAAGVDAPRWSIRVRRAEDLDSLGGGDCAALEEVVLEIDPARPVDVAQAAAERLASTFGRDRVRLAVPIIARAEAAEACGRLVRDLRAAGWRRWEIGNPAGFAWCGGDADLAADWPLYTLNASAAAWWREHGVGRTVLSPEDGRDNWTALLPTLGDGAVVPVFQHMPLFISETPPESGLTQQTGLEYVTRRGRRFRVAARKPYVLTALEPFCLSGRIAELVALGARRLRIDLTWSDLTSAGVAELWRAFQADQPWPGAELANFVRGFR